MLDNRNANINITGNEINWLAGNWLNESTQQSLTGITVNNAIINNVGTLNITKNNIANLQKGITLTMQGYEGTGNNRRVQVIDNKIRFNQFKAGMPTVLHYGIGLFNSRRVTIDGNGTAGDILRITNIPGTYNTQPQVELFNGIKIVNSAEAWITNVNIDKLPASLYVEGSCPNSNFWCNKFDNARNGVRLLNAIIGNQLNLASPYTNAATNNQWNSPTNNAFMINGNVASAANWYWSGAINGVLDPSPAFLNTNVAFLNPTNTNSPCGYLLRVQPNSPTTSATRSSELGNIVNNTLTYTDHVPENKLWADKYAYKKLRKNSDLVTMGTPDDYQYGSYLTEKSATCTGKLDEISDYMDNSEAIVSQQINNAIVTNIPANIARKQVNDIYIRSWLKGEGAFSSEDSTYLCDLGSLDPLIYGDAVYTAQVMLQECMNISSSTARVANMSYDNAKIESEQKSKPSVIPNPNNGIMYANIQLKKKETGELQIYSMTGKLISTYVLNEDMNDFVIDQSSLESGIYFYRITINGMIRETKKLVIVK